MRRSAILGIMLAGGLAAGCGTSPHYRNIDAGRTTQPIVDSGLTRVSGSMPEGKDTPPLDEFAEPAPKRPFAKGNVPDNVMLRDQVDTSYRDNVIPN